MISYEARRIKSLNLSDYWKIIESWPDEESLLTLGGQGSTYKMIALDFEPISRSHFMGLSLDHLTDPELNSGPIFYRYIGCVNFEEFTALSSSHRSKFYKIKCAIVFDKGEAWLVYDRSYHRGEDRLKQVTLRKVINRRRSETASWVAHESVSDYLQKAQDCIKDIYNGRFYQINLLRYYSLGAGFLDWFQRFYKFSGPYGCWIRDDQFELVSFSPERFIATSSDHSGIRIVTEPIKGTSAVFDDPSENQKSKERLLSSHKDHAELHMIVDLMRNDLNRVCIPGSVKVEESNKLYSFKHVHHLIAKVSAYVRTPSTLEDLLASVCPGGSITGAPKKEVCLAIREYEGRERGPFMGNIVAFDPDHMRLDSSIMIRTAYRDHDLFHFAAGSGLTINSNPVDEAAEIGTKAKVVTAKVEDSSDEL